MRSAAVFFLALLCSLCADAQMAAQQPGTPEGTFFTESFGDTGTQPCGYGAPWNLGLYQYKGCNVIWGSTTIGTGGSISIANSPGATSYPRGPHSLKIVTGTGSTYLQTAGFTPPISASTPFDTQFTLYVASTALAAYDEESLYSLVAADGSGSPCSAGFSTSKAGSISLYGGGSTSSAAIPLSLSADHTVFMHCVPGGGSGTSWISLDGGTHETFEANAKQWTYQAVGNYSGDSDNVTYYIGNVMVNAAMQGPGSGPIMYNNLENGTNGVQLTTAILAAATVGGNGTYVQCSNGTYQTISTAAQLSLHQPVTVLGTQYTDSSATRGVAFAYAGSEGATCYYRGYSFSPVLSTFEWVETTLPTTDTTSFVSMDPLGNNAGSDFVSHMQHSGDLYIETEANPNGNPDIGAFFPYTPGVKYGIATQMQEYSAGSGAGGVYLVQGKVTSGTFDVGETLTQATSGATAQLLISPNGNNAVQISMISGTATATNLWTGQTSGAIITPTSLPTTFHTVKIYDQNCNLLSTQMKIAESNTPSIPDDVEIGRGGDSNKSGINSYWYEDNLFVDFASGNMISCH
jgi:hypothetical protein